MKNPTDDRLYFAYGSNLNMVQMHDRCKTAIAVRRLSIKNWKLVFRDVADIEKSVGSVVHGALYRVTPSDVAALDHYEGIASGLYRKASFRLHDTKAFFYLMNHDYVYPPSDYYYETIASGYLNWKIPLAPLNAALIEAYEHEQVPEPDDWLTDDEETVNLGHWSTTDDDQYDWH